MFGIQWPKNYSLIIFRHIQFIKNVKPKGKILKVYREYLNYLKRNNNCKRKRWEWWFSISEVLWQLKTGPLPCCEAVLSLVGGAAQSWSFKSSLSGFAAQPSGGARPAHVHHLSVRKPTWSCRPQPQSLWFSWSRSWLKFAFQRVPKWCLCCLFIIENHRTIGFSLRKWASGPDCLTTFRSSITCSGTLTILLHFLM